MDIIRLIKPALFLYESVKIIMLTLILMFLSPPASTVPWLIIAVPGAALFPLLALFLWLDISRYKAYLPLFLAGKCIGVFLLLIFSVLSGQFTIMQGFHGKTIYAELIFLTGDLLALAGILYIFKELSNKLED